MEFLCETSGSGESSARSRKTWIVSNELREASVHNSFYLWQDSIAQM